jgi:hypothetical protein
MEMLKNLFPGLDEASLIGMFVSNEEQQEKSVNVDRFMLDQSISSN